MTSRLDRLFILLETGTNAVTKRAAAQQLGEAQRLHPHELHHLLARVSNLLKSTQWDTRISAAHAVQAIISQVPVWDPKPKKKKIFIDKEELLLIQKSNHKLSLDNFDMTRVLAQSLYLTGSEGSEYDLVVVEGESIIVQDEKELAAKIGLHPHLMGVDTTDLFTSDDLISITPSTASKLQLEKISIEETLQQRTGLSRREMNRARRKARQSISKQRSREPDDNPDIGNCSNSTRQIPESLNKKMKLEDTGSLGAWYNSSNGTVIDSRCAVPDGTGCWPDTAIDWPLEAFAENLLQDLFSLKWEIRHGAATALREFIRLHGRGAGKSRNQTLIEMEESHRQWLIDAALRLLCVLGIDRFGDFISDQVVAPVRETCAQALGSLALLISSKKKTKTKDLENGVSKSSEKDEIERDMNGNHRDILSLLSVMLRLLEHNEWEARHGALLALKYLLAIRSDLLDEILPKAFPAIMKGLSDSVEDVGAMAASALIPVASDLPRLLRPTQLETIILRLWQLLKEQDDLAAACNSFMGLLAAILSLPTARAYLTPQPLSLILPRLWPFLNHSSSSVRKATLQTLETLTGEEGETDIDRVSPKERWGEEGGLILQEALRNVFQRVLIEHLTGIQEIAERVWKNLVVRSDLELLLHAACPLVSTWLCLAMQPEHVPFNSNLLINVASQKSKSNYQDSQDLCSNLQMKSSSSSSSSSSELKVYIGGIETIAQSTRHSNVVRARCMAARMLGLLSGYLVKPAPGLIYTPEIPSPSLCYAKVLLAHLNSRSALQRTVVALTMAHWATLDQMNPPTIPDILRKQLFICLNEYIYYDEIAASMTRLLHECRDYTATLKHYKLSLATEINTSGVMTLEQIAQLASAAIPGLRTTASNGPMNSTNPVLAKLKPKLIESLEDRRRALEMGALASSAQQQAMHITAMAALAGAATMLHCLPEAPQPLNPLVKPLMEAIKKEENEELQKLAAKHLAHLVDLCVNRIPCPNAKIVTNLCTFLCSDVEFTPRVTISDLDYEPFNGILTLSNRQKHAERLAYNRGTASGTGGSRGPGRPPTTDLPLEELLACEEPEAKASRTRRQGATVALNAIAILLGEHLPDKLPQLWNLMLPENLKNYVIMNQNLLSAEEANQLVFSLQVLEVIAPSLNKKLIGPIIECLNSMCLLLANPYKIVRHMASRCIAVLASLNTKETMNFVVHKIIVLLETNTVEPSKSNIMTVPNDVDARRQGAAEALTCLVENLGVGIVPYAVLFMVPLLGRMSDQNQAVRLACSATFATLVQLLPLEPEAIDASQLTEEKTQERHFLEQLLNPRSIPDTELTIPVAAELRSYQQQGLNWLSFLNRYQLHGVLCDDMGLGKTLQTLCILALDHHRNKQLPSSLVVCPPTLTGHWVYEAEKFFETKVLSVIQYTGNPVERERLRSRVLQYRLVVASYDIVRKDIDFFEAIQWNYCVLDEGHVIKNGKTKSAKAAKKLHAHHRLILSGTPVQNDVLELWSLFDFLMPGFLGSEKQFAAKYSRPILACREPKAGAKDQEAGALAMEALHRQVLPFLLRRNKEDVLQDLPPKITQDYYCDLSILQKTLYEDFKSKHSVALINNATSSNNPHGGHVFEALRYLRNVCNHPKLVLSTKHPQYQTVINMLKQQHSSLADIEHGAKLPALKQLLLDCGIGHPQQQTTRNSSGSNNDNQQQAQLVSQHRALIFCQLKAMLDIVEHDLLRIHLPNVTYLRLDGSVPAAQRHSVVARFNADPSIDVLLLTSQVGGLGLNLTGADTVIFVEHDWNPMKDLQAMDRAHRIGQKKVVNVYRLITRQTLEEKIMGLQKFKLLTANTIISTDNASLETMKTEQLLDLFSLDNDKKIQSDTIVEETGVTKMNTLPGVNKTVLDILPELWEHQQYDDEYDMDSFLTTLKAAFQ
ncbi:PREDICTED: TATA-binding protein-associated factor 172 [Ceratosolen solmsi marchali]|uniref:TATA-binding protein-associated factor 172 n=1 Tax=Ceratosolen solmsi marchali TaxID=326594 RepID=A0AAJ7DT94_9HYME|nr:PREDICTED: TATA-binding protein-associated factor 172 [Ceratosolen solmsi marchali]